MKLVVKLFGCALLWCAHTVGAEERSGALQVYFDSGAVEFVSAAQTALAPWLESMRASSKNIMLEGHCDERGSALYNLELGDRRARVVKAYLMSQGIAAERLLIVSKGEGEPVSAGHREADWAQNRRVTLRAL